MREPDFGCGRYLCDDPSSLPMWVVILLLIILALVVASFVGSKRVDKTLKEAVDDVLRRYEEQAQTWGDDEAGTAFSQARRSVAEVIDRYEDRPLTYRFR